LDQLHHFRSADGFDPDGSHAAFTPLPERVVKRERLVPRQRADHRGAAGQPARPRAGLAAPVPQLGAAAAVPPFEPGALPRIAVPVRVELPARPIELAPLPLAPLLQRVPVSGVPLSLFEAWLGA